MVSHSNTPLWSQHEVGEFQGKESFSVSLLGFGVGAQYPDSDGPQVTMKILVPTALQNLTEARSHFLCV